MKAGTVNTFLIKTQFNPENGCLEWTGSTFKNKFGIPTYGQHMYLGKNWLAHRYAWIYVYHHEVSSDEKLLHKCDNTLCVLEEHLYVGTPQQNTQDMVLRGRADGFNRKGESHPRHKLTQAIVDEIRADKYTRNKYFMDKYHISSTHVSRIRNGDRW